MKTLGLENRVKRGTIVEEILRKILAKEPVAISYRINRFVTAEICTFSPCVWDIASITKRGRVVGRCDIRAPRPSDFWKKDAEFWDFLNTNIKDLRIVERRKK